MAQPQRLAWLVDCSISISELYRVRSWEWSTIQPSSLCQFPSKLLKTLLSKGWGGQMFLILGLGH